MSDVAHLADLIRRMPVLRVNSRSFQPVKRREALAYGRAIDAWLCEAGNALAGIPADGGRVESRGMGEHRPNGEPSSELIPRDFSADRAG